MLGYLFYYLEVYFISDKLIISLGESIIQLMFKLFDFEKLS